MGHDCLEGYGESEGAVESKALSALVVNVGTHDHVTRDTKQQTPKGVRHFHILMGYPVVTDTFSRLPLTNDANDGQHTLRNGGHAVANRRKCIYLRLQEILCDPPHLQ